jgi:hypothetical protein
MPAYAGIQLTDRVLFENGIQVRGWTPVFTGVTIRAGMTAMGVDFESTNSEPLILETDGMKQGQCG